MKNSPRRAHPVGRQSAKCIVQYVLLTPNQSRASVLGRQPPRRTFWFVDGEMVGRSKPGETLLWTAPMPKTFLVRVVDDAGRAESRELTVEFLP